jgi:hypothetical protein
MFCWNSFHLFVRQFFAEPNRRHPPFEHRATCQDAENRSASVDVGRLAQAGNPGRLRTRVFGVLALECEPVDPRL